MNLPTEVTQLASWDRLDQPDAEQVALSIAKQLPAPWKLARVHEQQTREHRRFVAFFDWNGAEFALIPGGETLLGYDPSQPLDLTEQDLEDWEHARYEYGDLQDHLREVMTPLHQVVLDPFLMEVESHQMDSIPIWKSGVLCGRRTISITVGQVREWACADGFRVPTSDQWEHACRAGTRTFWWWGNMLSFPLPDRNPFGLNIALDTYRSEWCTDPNVTRGGDGGCACHGGLDGLPTALRLASAYFEPFTAAANESEQFCGDCRRVFPLTAN